VDVRATFLGSLERGFPGEKASKERSGNRARIAGVDRLAL